MSDVLKTGEINKCEVVGKLRNYESVGVSVCWEEDNMRAVVGIILYIKQEM